MSRFLGTKPLFLRCAQNLWARTRCTCGLNPKVVHACPCTRTLVHRAGPELGLGVRANPHFTPAGMSRALAGAPFLSGAGASGSRSGGPGPISCLLWAPPSHFRFPRPAQSAARPPAPTCHPHADCGGSVREAGSWLVAAAPPPPACSLVGSCGGGEDAGGAGACDVPYSVTSLQRLWRAGNSAADSRRGRRRARRCARPPVGWGWEGNHWKWWAPLRPAAAAPLWRPSQQAQSSEEDGAC